MKDKTTKLLEKSIKNLRENLDSLSMDKFVGVTIETLMSIERDEFLNLNWYLNLYLHTKN